MISPQLAFLDLGAPELIIILIILLLLFGSKKLPELSKTVGESMHELRKGVSGNLDNEKKENNKGPAGESKNPPNTL